MDLGRAAGQEIAFSNAEISSGGASCWGPIPSAARAWGEIGIDFSERAQTPPPAEISCAS